jgi:hypothetical protein
VPIISIEVPCRIPNPCYSSQAPGPAPVHGYSCSFRGCCSGATMPNDLAFCTCMLTQQYLACCRVHLLGTARNCISVIAIASVLVSSFATRYHERTLRIALRLPRGTAKGGALSSARASMFSNAGFALLFGFLIALSHAANSRSSCTQDSLPRVPKGYLPHDLPEGGFQVCFLRVPAAQRQYSSLDIRMDSAESKF